MAKEHVHPCMGPPANKAAEGITEVWAYNSGKGMSVTDASYAPSVPNPYILGDCLSYRGAL
jgi:hypothetical protein